MSEHFVVGGAPKLNAEHGLVGRVRAAAQPGRVDGVDYSMRMPPRLSKRDRTPSGLLLLPSPGAQKTRREKPEADVKSAPPSASTAHAGRAKKPRQWTKKEDDQLRAAIKERGQRNWKVIGVVVAVASRTNSRRGSCTRRRSVPQPILTSCPPAD
jgi:hypothetical protein